MLLSLSVRKRTFEHALREDSDKLRIRSVRSESLLDAFRIAKDAKFHITKTRLFKYIEISPPKTEIFQIKIFDQFHISSQNTGTLNLNSSQLNSKQIKSKLRRKCNRQACNDDLCVATEYFYSLRFLFA